MDQEEYSRKAIKKIKTFEKNGYFIGEQIILTYETKTHPLNMRVAERLIERYLL